MTMSIDRRTGFSVAALALVGALSACGGMPTGSGGQPSAAQEFPFRGKKLTIVADHAKTEVKEADVTAVEVQRHVTAVGKDPGAPAWSLTGDVLDLGKVCQDGYVGVCEVTYDVTVPRGTQVDVRD